MHTPTDMHVLYSKQGLGIQSFSTNLIKDRLEEAGQKFPQGTGGPVFHQTNTVIASFTTIGALCATSYRPRSNHFLA